MRWGVLSAMAVLAAPAGWREASRGERFALYHRARPGSPFHEYRAEGTFGAPIEAVERVLLDPLRYGANPTLVEERTLGEHSGRRVRYNRYDPPLGSDRDSCFGFTVEEGDGVWRLLWDDRVECVAPVDGVVRMRANEGFWELHAAGARRTRFVHQLFSDAGAWSGWAFVVNASTPGMVEAAIRAVERASASVKP